MPDHFDLTVPTNRGSPITIELKVGEVVYVLGVNGSGKSSLISHLYRQHHAFARRIAAHRQTWFESNALNLTPQSRQELESNLNSTDARPKARYSEWNASVRSGVAVFDLIDADTMQARKISALLRAGDDTAAKREAQIPSPIQTLNELMRLSNLPIEISVDEGQSVVAKRNGGAPYSVAELSDGERNAFLIAASILSAKAGTLILVDEPERHLHRSIISPLLKLLFEKRSDCAFVVSTHEPMLPLDTPSASTMLVRDCIYQGENVLGWIIDIVPPHAVLDEDIKRDLLGARRRIIYVEGTATSLDAPLYSLLFPEVSVIPKATSRDVEFAVKGLRGSVEMHWLAAWGIVDNDQRSADDISNLRDAGVWALSHYSVESLYYHPSMIARVAQRNAELTGSNAHTLWKSAIDDAVAAVRLQKEHLVVSAVLRLARRQAMARLPRRANVVEGGTIRTEVDVSSIRAEEDARFDSLIGASNWNGLLTRYPLRESAAFDRVISGLKIADRATYRSAVLKLLEDDISALTEMRGLLGDLYANVTA